MEPFTLLLVTLLLAALVTNPHVGVYMFTSGQLALDGFQNLMGLLNPGTIYRALPGVALKPLPSGHYKRAIFHDLKFVFLLFRNFVLDPSLRLFVFLLPRSWVVLIRTLHKLREDLEAFPDSSAQATFDRFFDLVFPSLSSNHDALSLFYLVFLPFAGVLYCVARSNAVGNSVAALLGVYIAGATTLLVPDVCLPWLSRIQLLVREWSQGFDVDQFERLVHGFTTSIYLAFVLAYLVHLCILVGGFFNTLCRVVLGSRFIWTMCGAVSSMVVHLAYQAAGTIYGIFFSADNKDRLKLDAPVAIPAQDGYLIDVADHPEQIDRVVRPVFNVHLPVVKEIIECDHRRAYAPEATRLNDLQTLLADRPPGGFVDSFAHIPVVYDADPQALPLVPVPRAAAPEPAAPVAQAGSQVHQAGDSQSAAEPSQSASNLSSSAESGSSSSDDESSPESSPNLANTDVPRRSLSRRSLSQIPLNSRVLSPIPEGGSSSSVSSPSSPVTSSSSSTTASLPPSPCRAARARQVQVAQMRRDKVDYLAFSASLRILAASQALFPSSLDLQSNAAGVDDEGAGGDGAAGSNVKLLPALEVKEGSAMEEAAAVGEYDPTNQEYNSASYTFTRACRPDCEDLYCGGECSEIAV
ncbi:hypothetical protein C8R44DRAFT_870020 [Mycena epipterygia]|nr:hypothetical protein C8R44DRAFT_870020 [Mycena epipterygia]